MPQKNNDALFQYSCDVIILESVLLIYGIYQNGINAFWHALVCCAVSVLSEYVCFGVFMKKQTLRDLSAVSCALTISLLLPACAPLWVGAAASLFSFFVIKLTFGSAKSVPFVPACAGICFVSMCFPEYMSVFASAQSKGLFCTDEAFVSGTTLLDILSSGKSIDLNVFGRLSLLSGSYPGAIGTTSVLLLFSAMIYLFVRRPKRLYATVGFITSAIVFCVLFPRTNSSVISSAILEISAGSFLFTAVLLINEPVTSPKEPNKALIYGAVAGVICMLLRRYAKIYDTDVFSVLLINAIWPAIVREDFGLFNKRKKSSHKAEKIGGARI